MKKSFMTRVLAVSLSAAMAFSLPSANLMTASAAATVTIAKTASVKVGNTKTLKLKKNNSDWKITKVATNKSKVCTAKKKSNKAFTITGVKKGTATISVTIKSPKRKAAGKAQSKWKKVLKCKVTVKPKTTTPTTPTTTPTDPSSATDPTDASTPTSATDPTGATTPTGATDPSAPTGELGLTTVRSVARTTVEVVFNQPVDAVSKDNFKITEKAGTETVGVEDAILSENKLTATLTLASNAKLGTDYVIEISGLTCGGTAQGTLQGEYTSLTTQDQFVAVMESDATYLKADNTSNTQVRFKIYDGTGKLRTDVNNVEVRFTTTRGSVGGQSVVVRNGVADVQFTSQNVTSDVTAVITGEVIKADGYGDLLGLKSTTSILLTLNPGDIDASQGALLTSINAITADRIIAYFNKEVKPEDFLQANGKVNTNRAEVTVTDRVGLGDNTVNVTTILPLEEGTNKEKALQILVDRPLTDNSEISLKFVDKRYSVPTANTAYDRLVDATPPAVYNVNPKNLREIEVIFSEAVLTDDLVKNESNAIKDLSAQNVENYRINGQKLRDISKNASVKVSTDADKRHIVTITLGTEDGTENGRPIYLNPNTLYSVQASNIGDWAALTDAQMNVVHTQTFYFDVTSDNTEPEGEATIQSPEQYLVKFNGQVAVAKGTYKNKTIDKLGSDLNNAKILTLQEYDSRDGWKDIDFNGGNPIRIRKVSGTNEYIVELTTDWTWIYNTQSTGDNYYRNHRFRLYAEKNSLYNYDNGSENSKDLEISLTDSTVTGCEKLLNEDNTSPEIQNVQPSGKYYYVQLDEPVQVSMNSSKYPDRTPTPSQKQNGVIQRATARFVNTTTKDTIDGVVDEWLYEDDTWVRIEPEKVLSAGEWELTITALTDDVGNTISSKSYKFTVEGATSSGLHVVWAAASNVDDYEVFRKGEYEDGSEYPSGPARYIFIKFSEPMTNNALSTSALVNSNYTISGVEVPRTGNVVGYIKNYSANNLNTFDSVTIDLGPNYQSFNLSEGRQVALTIASSITAASGNVLGDTGRITLPRNYGTNDGNITTLTNRYSNITTANDDVWGNDTSETAGFGFAKLQAALKDDSYRTVILPETVKVAEKTTLEITRPVELDVNGKRIELTENRSGISISYSDTGIVKIVNNDTTNAGTIVCSQSGTTSEGKPLYLTSLTIDTPNTDLWVGGKKISKKDTDGNVVDSVTNTGGVNINSLNIKDIKANTFINFNGTIRSLVVTDGGGTGIVNAPNGTIDRLELNGAAKFVLTNYNVMNLVHVVRANTVEVKADKYADGTLIAPIGDIKSDKTSANLIINIPSGKTVTDVVRGNTGFGSVTNSSGTDIATASKVYSSLVETELGKITGAEITSGDTLDIKGAVDSPSNVQSWAKATVSYTDANNVTTSYDVTYRVEYVNYWEDYRYLAIGNPSAIRATNTNELNSDKTVTVKVIASITVDSKEIVREKTIDIKIKK